MPEQSLAQYISDTREKLGLSQSGLAKKSNLPLAYIEDIESGKELFLPSTLRQKLAKGLRINPAQIKIYEKETVLSFENIDKDFIEELKERILNGDSEGLKCPVCSSPLTVRIAKMYDLEDNLVLHPKATCTKCPFQIK